MLVKTSVNTAHIPVRPPHVLVPIIADGLKQARRNITEVGSAMVEARSQMTNAAFLAWSEKNFRLKRTQTLYYLDIGGVRPGGPTVSSVKEHRRNRRKNKKKPPPQSAHSGNGAASPAATMPRSEHQVGVDLIEAGFRTLAKTLHPDKGGSQSSMVALSKVRTRLKALWG